MTVRTCLKPVTKIKPFKCDSYNKKKHKNLRVSSSGINAKKTRLGYKRKPITLADIEEKSKREAQLEVMREILENQARKIQRMK